LRLNTQAKNRGLRRDFHKNSFSQIILTSYLLWIHKKIHLFVSQKEKIFAKKM